MTTKEIKAKLKAAMRDRNENKETVKKSRDYITENSQKVVDLTEQIEAAEERRKEILRQVAVGEATPQDLEKLRAEVVKLSNERADAQEIISAFKEEIRNRETRFGELQHQIKSMKNKYFKARFREYLDKNGEQVAEAYALFNLSMRGEMRAPAPMMFLNQLELLKPELFRKDAIFRKTEKMEKDLKI